MSNIPVKRRVIGVLLGLGAGWLTLFSLVSISGVYNLDLVPFVIAMLYAFSGYWGALAAIVSTTGVTYVMLSGLGLEAFLPLFLLASILPSIALMRLVANPPTFRRGACIAALSCCACALAALMCLWLPTRADLVGLVTRGLPELLYAHFHPVYVDQLGAMLGHAWSMSGFDGTVMLPLEASVRAQLWDGLMFRLDEYLRLSVPSILVCAGITTGVLSYWAALAIRRRGQDADAIPYLPIVDWRAPRDAIVYLPLMTLVLYILAASGFTGLSGLDAAFNAVFNLSYLLFTAQGLGALARLMQRAQVRPGMRGAYLAAMALIARPVVAAMGVYSAFLGGHGLVTQWLIRKRNQSDD